MYTCVLKKVKKTSAYFFPTLYCLLCPKQFHSNVISKLVKLNRITRKVSNCYCFVNFHGIYSKKYRTVKF